ncbi:hypothetical protein [Naasia lichenicola]|uniref:Uncharacterized protein n=1 Tax=Naasia lichenicola TaxID=2565933 RepID=A0A4S4FTL8_9MICO|nr:hypothetical protein [Naasia lichenicola]AGU10303.1 hypothetical protein [uncultured organism]THG32926.1 hypothetical protein E6C64_00695 [Naasia lichenicola]
MPRRSPRLIAVALVVFAALVALSIACAIAMSEGGAPAIRATLVLISIPLGAVAVYAATRPTSHDG